MDNQARHLLTLCEYALGRLELANEDTFDPDGMLRLRDGIAKARGEYAIIGGSPSAASALDDLANDVKLQTPTTNARTAPNPLSL